MRRSSVLFRKQSSFSSSHINKQPCVSLSASARRLLRNRAVNRADEKQTAWESHLEVPYSQTQRLNLEHAIWLPRTLVEADVGKVVARNPHHTGITPAGSSPTELVNCAFVCETDLLVLLSLYPALQRTTTSSPKTKGKQLQQPSADNSFSVAGYPLVPPPQKHYIFWRQSWTECEEGRHHGFEWLSQSIPAIQTVLNEVTLDEDADQQSDCNEHHGEKPAAFSTSHDYMQYMISPHRLAGQGRPNLCPDKYWISREDIERNGLDLFDDAFYVPFHWNKPLRTFVREQIGSQSHEWGYWFFDSNRSL